MSITKIRNFCIIAHIDHGKSTLADRLLQLTLGIPDRQFRDQILDTMDIEQERGITIKSQAVALPYKDEKGDSYLLNLIDTPGHVDFSYEVSRSLAACEGALILVDASQGVEAQTIANLYMALEQGLTLIPIINKIDLPSADVEMAREAIESELGLEPDDAVLCSAKTGLGVENILKAVVDHIPAPEGEKEAPLQALIFDSIYNQYRGVVIYVRIMNGQVKAGDQIKMMSTGAVRKVEEVGVLQLKQERREILSAGEVGYIIAGIKTVAEARTGDTITLVDRPCKESLKGFVEVKSVVFSSFYPVSTHDYPDLVDAMERLQINDAALSC